ncbi:SHOCT domain-containing protein [Pseudonocardia sp. CA-107938]|uniref:SHOCT domain-containing protein n=1 Tax=Pseudonocardia sp. CA-107938 TaxID=3240021 RepID=UPI003D93A68C
MMWWYGPGMGGWGWVLMIAGGVLPWVLVVVALVVMGRRGASGAGGAAQPPPVPRDAAPEEVLAHRFASGEIDAQEYRDRLDVLRGGSGEALRP